MIKFRIYYPDDTHSDHIVETIDQAKNVIKEKTWIEDRQIKHVKTLESLDYDMRDLDLIFYDVLTF